MIHGARIRDFTGQLVDLDFQGIILLILNIKLLPFKCWLVQGQRSILHDEQRVATGFRGVDTGYLRNRRWTIQISAVFLYLAILCDLFGMVKWPFKRLSDLQLRDQKVTLNHLIGDGLIFFNHVHFYLGKIPKVWLVFFERLAEPPPSYNE